MDQIEIKKATENDVSELSKLLSILFNQESDNDKAIRFYYRYGFTKSGMIPLRLPV